MSVARFLATAADPGPAWLSVGSHHLLRHLVRGQRKWKVFFGGVHGVKESYPGGMTPRPAVHFCPAQADMFCIFTDMAMWGILEACWARTA